MSGHSKWSQIKRAKGATDAKRGQLFTKLGREITVAARQGGPSVEGNSQLRMAVDRARVANMPMDTVQRAIARGAGAGEGANLDEVMYEGYAPGGAALLIEATTDNRNRTVAEVRATLSRGGGTFGEAGSVAWSFEQRGVIMVEPKANEDPEELALKAIDAGADDFNVEDGELELLTDPAELEKTRRALLDLGISIVSAELTMIPKTPMELSPEQTAQVMRLVERLEDLDDVTRVHTNVHLTEASMAQFA